MVLHIWGRLVRMVIKAAGLASASGSVADPNAVVCFLVGELYLMKGSLSLWWPDKLMQSVPFLVQSNVCQGEGFSAASHSSRVIPKYDDTYEGTQDPGCWQNVWWVSCGI